MLRAPMLKHHISHLVKLIRQIPLKKVADLRQRDTSPTSKRSGSESLFCLIYRRFVANE